MWSVCYGLSIACLAVAAIGALIRNNSTLPHKYKPGALKVMTAGAFGAAFFLFLPVQWFATAQTAGSVWQTLVLTILNSIEIFGIGCDFGSVEEAMEHCPDWLDSWYLVWTATMFMVAPVLTFGVILSFFRDLSAFLKYRCMYFKEVFIFSELNKKSLALAEDIQDKNPKAAIVFAGVTNENEAAAELVNDAKSMGAICFKKDVLNPVYQKHSPKKPMWFFAISGNEANNLTQALRLIDTYRDRELVNIYVFSTKIDGELRLAAVDKGKVRVRRVNEVQSLINRLLYERGQMIFQSAAPDENGNKQIHAVLVGMGRHGTEMMKALSWFCQMDGYGIHIHGFDKDPLAQERFTALAPELMSPKFNGVYAPGETQYTITVHSGVDVESATFEKEIQKITDATYVLVSLGDDDTNIKTAVKLRMYFERMKIHPVIQAIVYDSEQKKAVEGVCNYRGQAYDISLIGDIESSYTQAVIINSELEEDALARHLKWGEEEEFWTYEYNYRSSVASAIHMRARILCGIPGADKKEVDLTDRERSVIETLEHRRWNAYMRSEGYVFSGSHDPKSRNDLAKMHHDLVNFDDLSEEEKRKDGKVGVL